MSKLLSIFDNLDWGNWFYGLLAAIISGGASAVTSAFTIQVIDPEHFNLHTGAFYEMVGAIFTTTAITGGFAFLKQNPVPKVKTVVTTSEITETIPSGKVVTTVQETHKEDIS